MHACKQGRFADEVGWLAGRLESRFDLNGAVRLPIRGPRLQSVIREMGSRSRSDRASTARRKRATDLQLESLDYDECEGTSRRARSPAPAARRETGSRRRGLGASGDGRRRSRGGRRRGRRGAGQAEIRGGPGRRRSTRRSASCTTMQPGHHRRQRRRTPAGSGWSAPSTTRWSSSTARCATTRSCWSTRSGATCGRRLATGSFPPDRRFSVRTRRSKLLRIPTAAAPRPTVNPAPTDASSTRSPRFSCLLGDRIGERQRDRRAGRVAVPLQVDDHLRRRAARAARPRP